MHLTLLGPCSSRAPGSAAKEPASAARGRCAEAGGAAAWSPRAWVLPVGRQPLLQAHGPVELPVARL